MSFTRPCLARLAQAAGLLLPVFLLISGCQPAVVPAQPDPTSTPAADIMPQTITQAPDSASGPGFQPPAGDGAPLRFTFPTPGSAPISLWRPPLYDTPWALGPYDHFYFSRPIAADEVNWPLADYRYGGTFFADTVHTGIDITAPRNTPVLAAGNGRVISAGYGLFYGNNDPNDPYGLAVVIRHDFGYQGQHLYTVYGHMDKILATEGQDVKTGDVLGLVGTTGQTTGPHLHFEVRIERNSYYATLNPELWLAPPQGWGVLVGRVENTNGSLLEKQEVYVRNLETNQKWTVRSYGSQALNNDPYYQENVVLSDLPAGQYSVEIDYQDEDPQTLQIEIHPGGVSYFTFRGKLYFDTSLPPTPSVAGLIGNEQP
mgnify:CR=1 FL=1